MRFVIELNVEPEADADEVRKGLKHLLHKYYDVAQVMIDDRPDDEDKPYCPDDCKRTHAHWYYP